jgi:deazaflavin-dependent oxidoreductase (nitroreductase family)
VTVSCRVVELTRKLALWISSRPWIGKARPAIVGTDRVLYKLTKGRVTVTGMSGMPSLTLTVKGRKTGEPRQASLLYMPQGEDCLLVGSNWGGENHPMWTVNLLANPDATVNIGGKTREVRAHLLSGAEREEAWTVLAEAWPAYNAYQQRTSRELRVFRLTPR